MGNIGTLLLAELKLSMGRTGQIISDECVHACMHLIYDPSMVSLLCTVSRMVRIQ